MPDFFYLSLLAEIILSLMLIVIWMMQSQERHALYWGLGQLSLALMASYWHESQDWFGRPPYREVLSVLLITGAFLYWSGTRFFLGQPLAWRARFWVILLPLLVYLADTLIPWGPNVPGLLALALVMIWCGWQMARQQHAYRLVGWLLIYRGIANLLFIAALGGMPWLLVGLYVNAFFAKIASALGLLYAVWHEASQRYTYTLRNLNDGFLLVDGQGWIRQANQAPVLRPGQAAWGNSQERSIQTLFPAQFDAKIAPILGTLQDANATFPVVLELEIPDQCGAGSPVELSIAPYKERGQTLAMIQIRDISERKRHERLLEQMANIDEVSGLCNRNALNARLSAMLAARACALLFIDLDHFKRINDTLGHAMGDVLLRQAGARLNALMGPEDVVARFGGDEFVVVLAERAPDRVRQRALTISAAILNAFAEPFVMPRLAAVVTPSIGVALCPEHGEDAETLLKYADIAMYVAKQRGRNEVCFFDDTLNQSARLATQMEGELRLAIARQELTLVYQPIVDADSHRLKKVEALLRWQSTTLGFIAPDRFIPVAEESGQIVAIGEWVLREACHQAGLWQGGPLGDTVLSVNVSAWQLADARFVSLLTECLQENRLPASCLELELTERVLIEEDGRIQDTLQAIQVLGVKISLDDFGTGYSSLNYLTRFHLDTLKIDRSFIHDLAHSPRSQNLAQAIIAMGRSLDIELVAEGVETGDQATMLKDMGCQYLQGYFFSKPVSAQALLSYQAPG